MESLNMTLSEKSSPGPVKAATAPAKKGRREFQLKVLEQVARQSAQMGLAELIERPDGKLQIVFQPLPKASASIEEAA